MLNALWEAIASLLISPVYLLILSHLEGAGC